MQDDIVLHSPVLEELTAPYAHHFPSADDFAGYRHHCLRMLNVALRVSDDEPDRRHKLDIALAFHDLTLFPARTLDYLDTSIDLATRHLEGIGRSQWTEEVALMIANHHKVRPYRGPHANLVEAVRKADWIDVSLGALGFGIDRAWLKRLHTALPLQGFYPGTLSGVIARYAMRHPFRPMPNFRW